MSSREDAIQTITPPGQVIQPPRPIELDSPHDVVDVPTGEVPEISDDRIREIMATLGVILHDQIADANTFFGRGNEHNHLDAFPMDDTELDAWRSVYGLDRAVEEGIEKKSLYLVNIDDAPLALPNPSANEGLVQTDTPEPDMKSRESGDMIRVNYGGETHWVPRNLITLVESADDLTYLMTPQIYFGGRGYTAGHLYNAFVSVNALAQAANGVQLVSDVYRKGFSGKQPPVFNPHTLLDTSLWMNTSIKQGEPNDLSIRADKLGFLMLGGVVNDVSSIPKLEIPRYDKVRTWFWQLDRLMNNQALALPPSPSLPELEAK